MSPTILPGFDLENLLDAFEREFVALVTITDKTTDKRFEAGGVYQDDVKLPHTAFRAFDPREPVAACPGCGLLFAATESATPDQIRDLHFFRDTSTPALCSGFNAETHDDIGEQQGESDHAGD